MTNKNDFLEKKYWLIKHFGEVACKPAGDGVVASVPGLFRTKPSRFVAGRYQFILSPVTARGADEDGSISALFNEIANTAGTRGFRLYQPKEGQSVDDIRPGEPYTVVQQDDREHRHGSPKLLDFIWIDIIRKSHLFRSRMPEVKRGSLSGDHCHFLIE